MTKSITWIGLLAIVFAGCDGFFGTKTDSSFIDIPTYSNNTVAYVPIQPVLTGFVRPTDVICGFDQQVYVADAGAGQIVGMDQSGRRLGTFPVPGLIKIAQDRSLDILAIGTFDTVIGSTPYTLSCIYRIDLKGSTYGLNSARIERKMVHPFYFKSSFAPAHDELVQITGIGIMADNSYYVSRTGPYNFTVQFGGPDDNVLLFNSNDQFITPLQVTTGTGIYSDYFKVPSSVITLAQPPQSPVVNTSKDFIFASRNSATVIKVQYISVLESESGITYSVKSLTADTTRADRFLYDANRFANPSDLSYSGDGTNLIFVTDAEKDSVFIFTNAGWEGVKPPPGSGQTRYINVSFGGTGPGLTQFNEPSGVAYLNQILYVADAGNGRILRFRLTTDFD